ncbi:MAG: right-handed parallel beta-helix repeat-containing protein [Ectothiorhodospiraceae bacterium]|nr:right-handed parallel beta-helix repeat-containing protein [Ectothiorhodospiraceae bacterium]
MAGVALTALGALASAAEVAVTSAEGLASAMAAARPGDVLVVAPGSYRVSDKLRAGNDGSADAPIVVRGARPGAAVLEIDTLEGILVQGTNWHFEDLVLVGICARDEDCEHAFQLHGDADGTQIRGCELRDFNAHIKASVRIEGEQRAHADRVLVEGNTLFNTRPRDTEQPVTPIDVVGGAGWVVRDNYIADFGRLRRTHTTYGVFLKGNSRDGVIERNLVVCADRHSGGARVGISLGGGGTGQRYCVDGDCTYEHTGGTVRNNIVANCSDAGIYLNRARASRILGNTLYASGDIEVRFAQSDAVVANNLVSRRVRSRNGGKLVEETNRSLSQSEFEQMFRDPRNLDFTPTVSAAALRIGKPLDDLTEDYCGTRRIAPPTLGAVERGVGPICRKEPAPRR